MIPSADFTEERSLFVHWRPYFGSDICLFIPNRTWGVGGYVTFGSDAQRLSGAIEELAEPGYVAHDDILWLPDASAARQRRLAKIKGCTIVFQDTPPFDTEPTP